MYRDTTEPILAVRDLAKSFGGAHALKAVDLSVLPGEVHGLLGQNGSGKSTLIKILAGYHAPDRGGIRVNGEIVKLPLSPGDFRKLGISFVHQDLGLVPSLTVLENFLVGELASTQEWGISWKKKRRRVEEIFARYGLRLSPAKKVADLSQTERALVAIVRAVTEMRTEAREHVRRGVLVLDEPTAFLPRAGVEQLFALVREIAAAAASVLFVSHDLDEVIEITDRATVLRDGRAIGTVVTRDATTRQLVEMIVGRRLESLPSHTHKDLTARNVLVSISDLSGDSVHDVSIDLHEGEVVGLTGLIGSGFQDVPYLVFGAIPPRSGRLDFGGKSRDLMTMTPAKAVEANVALIPADRPGSGSVGSLSVADNVTLEVLHDYVNGVLLDRRGMVADAATLLADYDVRPNNPTIPFQALSGGNQQKVLLAKWLRTQPALLLLDEATQGVDVGARQQIYALIDKAAKSGTAVLCASSDYEQLASMCDRVLIFSHGRAVRELVGTDVNKERIAEQVYESSTDSTLIVTSAGDNGHDADNR